MSVERNRDCVTTAFEKEGQSTSVETDVIVVAVTARLAAIGPPECPKWVWSLCCSSQMPSAYHKEYIALILTVDRLLDRFRTAVNVQGDSMEAHLSKKPFNLADIKSDRIPPTFSE